MKAFVILFTCLAAYRWVSWDKKITANESDDKNAKFEIERQVVKRNVKQLVVGFVTLTALQPYATMQVSFWFAPFVPILIEMIGLPSFALCWNYCHFYPINRGVNSVSSVPVTSPSNQH